MELFSILAIFFGIGGVCVALVNKKSHQVLENKNRWKKYLVYLILVFGQLFLIQQKTYIYFGILVLGFGFYEIVSIGTSAQKVIFSLIVFSFFSCFFYSFFNNETVLWQQFVFVIVITFDGYSQLSGQLFGKTKLFPAISPNKTLEGLAGGIFSVAVTSIILSYSLAIPVGKALAIGLATAVLSLAGDCLASYYKRMNNCKDYSRMIPNHGGFLDRFDSLIFAGFGCSFLLEIDFSNSLTLAFILYLLFFLVLFLTAEVMYHSLRLKVEITRKFVHFGSGVACLLFPYYFDSHWIVLVLCFGFLLILLLSQKTGLLKSINSISRKSNGSILFPVSVYVCFLFFQYYGKDQTYFYLPILILAICDPIAALVGKKFPFGMYKNGDEKKTVIGSTAFFICCFVIVFAAFNTYEIAIPRLMMHSFLVAITATLAEAISRNGLDNLMIPICVVCMLILLQ